MMRELLQGAYEKERERILALQGFSKYTGDYHNPVFGKGNLNARLMLIGEAPGSEEAKQGEPFVGKAGKQLDKLLSKAKIGRGEVFVTNAVKFRPTNVNRSVSNRTPAQSEIKDSLWLLQAEIECIRPRIVATLGNTPLLAVSLLFGLEPLKVGEVHGQAIRLSDDTTLFSLYHPASVIYNRGLMQTLECDIMQLGEIYKKLR